MEKYRKIYMYETKTVLLTNFFLIILLILFIPLLITIKLILMLITLYKKKKKAYISKNKLNIFGILFGPYLDDSKNTEKSEARSLIEFRDIGNLVNLLTNTIIIW